VIPCVPVGSFAPRRICASGCLSWPTSNVARYRTRPQLLLLPRVPHFPPYVYLEFWFRVRSVERTLPCLFFVFPPAGFSLRLMALTHPLFPCAVVPSSRPKKHASPRFSPLDNPPGHLPPGSHYLKVGCLCCCSLPCIWDVRTLFPFLFLPFPWFLPMTVPP